jgi:hypothetical protein
MTSEQKAFIKDNKKYIEPIFHDLFEREKNKVFLMPQGNERDIQVEFVKFLNDWLYQIEVCSKPELPGEKSFV